MDMEDRGHAWFHAIDMLGSISVDLIGCRKYVVLYSMPDSGPTVEVFYQTPDDKWFWRVEARVDLKRGGYSPAIGRQCSPEEVAHKLIMSNAYEGRLPQVLEQHRPMGDPRTFHAFIEANKTKMAVLGGQYDRVRPIWNGRVLSFDGDVCKEFTRPSGGVLL